MKTLRRLRCSVAIRTVPYSNSRACAIRAAVKLDVLKFAEHGAPLLGVGIIINVKTLEDEELIRKFLRGLSGGIKAAMKNPDAAADSALKVFKERKRETVMKFPPPIGVEGKLSRE